MTKHTYDAIVIGGGPGGSSAATFIAQSGHSVLLLEKDEFPRHQIGESLLPSTIQGICSLLGVKETVDNASFIPKKGGTLLWGKSKEPWTFYFEKPAPGQEPRPTAYQVERHKFDKILLDNAIQNGVIVKKRCKVLNVLKNNNRITGVNYKDVNGNLNQAYASYTIDASGHSSPVYHNVGKRIYSDFFQNIAIYGYYENGKRLPTPNENNILCAAFKHGWIWYIPLSSELTSVGVVIDRNALEKGIDLKHTYENWILSCPMVADLLADANRSTKKIYSQLRVRKDFSYTNTNLWTHGMALIGDAACFVDPLFSSGVHLSTLSALFVARSVNTYLKGTFDEETCFKEFEKRYRNEYSNFYNYLVAFYDFDQTENDYYWAARKILNTDEANNEAFIKIVSGYSTQGVKSSSEINRYFEDRAGFGKSLESFYVNKQQDISSNDNINIDKFMQGFTKEIVSVQAEAAGLNIPQESEGSLISSDDHLHWC